MSDQQILDKPLMVGDLLDVSPAERLIAEALLRCAARWGITKTTIEDIAREAGVSRATVYRHFPGSKSAILETAWSIEVCQLMDRVRSEVDTKTTLEDALVCGVHLAGASLGGHPALTFMREHEPAEFEQLIAFDRLDDILIGSAEVMAPLLSRFVPLSDAYDIVMWAARLLVSYLSEPANYADITSESDVRMLVRTFIIPGAELMSADSEEFAALHSNALAAQAADAPALAKQAVHSQTLAAKTTASPDLDTPALNRVTL